MSDTPIHHYTFRATIVPSGRPVEEASRRNIGSSASSPADAERRIRLAVANLVGLELLRVEPAGDGCGDDRCSVCNPSSRNQGTL